MKKRINDFIKYIEYEKRYSKETTKNYERDLQLFDSFLENNNIKDVDSSVIRNYLKFLYEKGYSSKTISRNLSSLRSFYKYEINNGNTKINPCALISNPKLDKKLPNFLSYTEIEDIISLASKDEKNGVRNSLIIELLYSTGVRVSEIVNIKIKDINLSTREIVIFGKGSKERIVLFGDLLKKLIIEYLDIRNSDSEYLIINKYGKKMSTKSIEDIIKKVVKLDGIKNKVTPHTIRHTFATHMLNEGADLKVVQELLGHENLETTEIYTHVSNERLRKVYLSSHPRAKK